MKYYKAEQALPPNLLREVRRHIPEGLLYIQKASPVRRRWGEMSGERVRIDRRNAEIRAKHQKSVSFSQLSDEYHLSIDTIKKIVYRK